jgi:hypothetical protein
MNFPIRQIHVLLQSRSRRMTRARHAARMAKIRHEKRFRWAS